MWTMDTCLNCTAVVGFCMVSGLDVDTDGAFHTIVSAFLEGKAPMLSETAGLSDLDGAGSSKSGLELWRLLKCNFGRLSAFNIIGALEISPAPAKHDILPKLAFFERANQEYERQALASSDRDFSNMCHRRTEVYPKVFKNRTS